MKQITNLSLQPVPLEDGTILAAAGTDGSTKQVESISEGDEARLVGRGVISSSDVEYQARDAETGRRGDAEQEDQ